MPHVLVSSLLNMGLVYIDTKRYEMAIIAYERSKSISDAEGIITGSALAMLRIGLLYDANGEYRKALDF